MNSLRRNQICKLIEARNAVSIRELSAAFPDVSLMTIHRDLEYLEEQGLIVRVRGGARSPSLDIEPKFEVREIKNRDAKDFIAKKATPFVKAGASIFLDSGTTIMSLVRLMPDVDLSIITCGPNIALEACKKQNSNIMLCGGSLNKSNLTLSGSWALDMVSKINIDVAFIVASGYTPESGFCCGKESEAQIKAAIIKRARTAVMLMDSSKLGRVLPFTFAELKNISYLISDDVLPTDMLTKCKAANVAVI